MIRIFEQGHEDFTNMGLGEIHPLSCVVHEEQGGAYELELEMPMDESGHYDRLKSGRVLVVPVPSITTPAVRVYNLDKTEYWKTTGSVKLYTQKSDVLGAYETVDVPAQWDAQEVVPDFTLVREAYSYEQWVPNGNRALQTIKAFQQVTVLDKSDAEWWRVTSAEGKTGYVQADKLTFVETYTATPGDEIQKRKIREQPFRIYRVEKDTAALRVRAWARHVYYDLLGVTLTECKLPRINVVGALAYVDERANPVGHGFSFLTNSVRILPRADYTHRNMVDAHLNPDDGILVAGNMRMIRDNYDVFFLKRSTVVRGTIMHSHNLMGVTVDVNEDGIINRIIPVGKTEDGGILYRNTTYPAVSSPRNTRATKIRCKAIEYDVQIGEDYTRSQAQQKLDALAKEEFEKGIDLPDITVTIDFLQLGDTDEYAQYRDMDRLYLSDIVRIVDTQHGVDLEAEVTEYDYDCLTQRYLSIGVGVTSAKRTVGSLGSYVLPSGSITGTKLAPGSVDGSRLQDGSVASPQLAPEAVQPDHLSPRAVEIISQSATGQQVMVRLSHGGILDAENTSTTASLHVYHQGVDITDTIPDAAVRWERVSDDAAADADWNADPAHQGVKSLEITGEDVDFRCVLRCLADEAVLYAVPDYADGDLLLGGPDAANFSLADGQLMYSGEIDYTLRDGELSAISTVGSFALEVQLSNLLTEQASQTRYGYEVYAGGNVKISAGGDLLLEAGSEMNAEADLVRFTTDSFNILNKSDRELLRLEEDELAVGADVISADRYVGPIVSVYDEAVVPWQGSIQASIDNLPKYLNTDTTLTVPAGTYNEDVVITGFQGSLLRLALSSGVTIRGSLDINNCGNFDLQGNPDKTSSVVSRNTSYAITAKAVGRFNASNVRVSGKYRTTSGNGTTHGFFLDGVQGAVTNCVMEKVSYCLTAGYGSSIYAANNKGGTGTSPTGTANLIASYRATVAGIIFLAGTAPDAPALTSVAGGQINGASTPTTETSTIPNTPDPTVTKYNAGVTAGAKVPFSGSSVFSTGVYLAQGTTGTYDKPTSHFGLWMLPTITNKASATKVTLTVRRSATGGTISAVPFRLMYTTSDWASISGVSMIASTMRGLFTDTGLQADLVRGQSVTWNITGSLLTAFKNGTIKGFGMRDAIGSNLYYMPMDRGITIEVTTP